MEDNSIVKIGCIGSGVMGSALMRSICKTIGPSELIISDTNKEKAQVLADLLACTVAETNAEVVHKAAIVFLAVKPIFLLEVLEEAAQAAKDALCVSQIFVSMAAGVSLETMRDTLGENAKIIRIMPNIPITVEEGVIALCATKNVSMAEIAEVSQIMEKAGLVETVEERLLRGITAISGSGPAYGFIFIEALADAAVRFGIPRENAIRYAAQTLKGAASMVLETGLHPAALKDMVCSPAGTTIEAVHVLEEEGFRSAIQKAAYAAYQKS